MNNISKMDVKGGVFRAYIDGEQLKIPLNEIKTWVPEFCQYGNDYSAEFAEISIGSQGSDEGWSTMIIRSEEGKKLLTELIKMNYIEIKKINDFTIINTNLKKKKKTVLKIAK